MTKVNAIAAAALLATAGVACEPKQDLDTESRPGVQLDERQRESPAMTSAVAPTMNQMVHDATVPGVSLRIVSPTANEVLPAGQPVEVSIQLDGYRTGKTVGQHVHVIVDNEPYEAYYDLSEPLELDNLSPGKHVIRAFPARHYHMSLKGPDVFDVVTFQVGDDPNAGDAKLASFDPDKPLLTYSRPKGDYPHEAAAEILLDFYLHNVELGPNQQVIYSVNGDDRAVTEWKPVLLPKLEPGQHEVRLQLVDAQGDVIENGGFNDTTRTITVKGPQATARR